MNPLLERHLRERPGPYRVDIAARKIMQGPGA
jgi:hypothetical protein